VVWGDDWVEAADRGVPALFGELMAKAQVAEWEVDTRRGRSGSDIARDLERDILGMPPAE